MCGDLAVLARPGAPERRAEVAGTEEAIAELGLEIARIEEPGTLDGGDVLQVGTTLYVGRGGRTNGEGIRQLRRRGGPRGRAVVPVPLRGAAPEVRGHRPAGRHDHLRRPLPARHVAVPDAAARPEEEGSHVVLAGDGTVLMAASAPRTAELFQDWGFDVLAVDISEFEKMEGCVTCLSVLIGSARGEP